MAYPGMENCLLREKESCITDMFSNDSKEKVQKTDNKYSYLAKNTILLTLSHFGSSFLSFFLVPLYTDVLTTSEYGIADAVKTSVTLLIYICTLNIGSAVLRFSIDNKETSHYVLRYSMRILLYGSIVVSCGLCIIYYTGFIKVDYYVLFFVLGLFVANAIESILYQYLRGIDKVQIMAIAGFISTLMRLGLVLLTLLVFKWGLFGYLLSMMLGSLSAVGYSLINCRNKLKATLDMNELKKLHKEMVRFSIPVAIGQLGWWVNNSIDRYVVIGLKGAALNGIYAMSYKIPMIMAIMCNIFSQAWGISAIKEFDKSDSDGFYGKIYTSYNAGLCIVCSLLILANVPISRIMFHKEFFAAWEYSSILILGTAFSGLASFFSGIFNAAKKNSVIACSTTVSAIVNISLNLLLIPSFGALGAAIATCLSFYICFIICFINARNIIRFKVHLYRDLMVYALLIGQIVCEHIMSHLYVVQVLIVGIIVLLYYSQIVQIVQIVMQRIQHLIQQHKENSKGD